MSFTRGSIASSATATTNSQGQDANQGTFGADDDYADDYVDAVPVDLSAYLGTSLEDVVDIEVEDEEEEGSEEEDEDADDEEEEEFETDDEVDELEPGDEFLPNTLSQEELNRQREYNKQILKEKKRDLIQEYLIEMERFAHVRAKNTFLMMKIASHVGKKQEVIDKYTDLEKMKQEQKRNTIMEKKKRIQEQCGPIKPHADSKPAGQKALDQYRKKKRKPKKRTMFEENNKLLDVLKGPTAPPPGRKFTLYVDYKTVPTTMLNKLRKKYGYNIAPVVKHGHSGTPRRSTMKGGRNSQLPFAKQSFSKQARMRQSKKIVDFSFRRSKFMKDAKKEPTKEEEMLDLKIDIGELTKKKKGKEEVYAPVRKSLNSQLKRRSMSISPLLDLDTLTLGKLRTGQFAMTEEAVGIAKSKARMKLAVNKFEKKVQLDAAEVTTENLNQFKFEFADPRLTAKQASIKIRAELMKLLRHRHIPTNHLTWPMEIKGVNFTNKNPYGRVALNYTRPTIKESEHPHTHYRMLLTNLAYLRTKEERMKRMHVQNMVELEDERARLSSGVQRIFHEIVEGLRIWASLSGYSSEEKREVVKDTEQFIEYLQEQINEKFFSNVLIDLYKGIISTEFALRRLSVSEGKGEGAELHEFKDIMRCREKLKMEHSAIQQSIERYQGHSMELLRNIRTTDYKKQELLDTSAAMTEDLAHLTTALSTMIDAMHFVHYLSKEKIKKESWMRSEVGLHGMPNMLEDYAKLRRDVLDMKFRRSSLQRQYNACTREIHKLKPVPPTVVKQAVSGCK